MSKHHCTSFGDPKFQYCLDCDQIGECFDERDRITLENMTRDILGETNNE